VSARESVERGKLGSVVRSSLAGRFRLKEAEESGRGSEVCVGEAGLTC